MPSHFEGREPFAWQDSHGVWFTDEHFSQKARDQGPFVLGEVFCRSHWVDAPATWFCVVGAPDILVWVPVDRIDGPTTLFG